MAYNQNKNPFQSKSPLNHNLRDKRTGTPYNHFHDPNSSKIYSSDQKVISGSNKFGGKKANRRFYDDKLDERVSEADLAREYAGQISSAYNSGQLAEGQFLADDLYNKKRKLSIQNGQLKINKGRMRIDKGSMFNDRKALPNEDGSYTIPETQYTEDQIYDMMVQGGGLVSIVDGKIVSGNPNEVMGEGYDKANRINTYDQDFRDNIYDSTARDNVMEKYKISEETKNLSQEKKEAILAAEEAKNLSDEERSAILTEKKNKILAARAAKAAEENRSIEERKALLQEKKNKILAARAAKSNSPVNNNSPLHQEQETDPITGQPKKNYVYDEGVEEVGETIEETIYNEDGSIKGTSFRTPKTTTFTGTETIENVEETPPSPNDRPDFKEDCEGIVMNMGNFSKSGFYKCDTAPSPPGGGTTPPGVIEEDITNTDTYSTVNYDERFEPVAPEPIPESASDLFNLRGAGKERGGFLTKVDWDLRLPQFGPEFNEWVKNLTKSGKKCGNCDYLNR